MCLKRLTPLSRNLSDGLDETEARGRERTEAIAIVDAQGQDMPN